jgi:ABC-2 type transport system permease protein
MRREGSAFQGIGTVVLKELADQLSSIRFIVLLLLIVLIGGFSVWGTLDQLKQTTAEDPFLLLKIVTIDR